MADGAELENPFPILDEDELQQLRGPILGAGAGMGAAAGAGEVTDGAPRNGNGGATASEAAEEKRAWQGRASGGAGATTASGAVAEGAL